MVILEKLEKLFEKISYSVYDFILTIDDKTLIPWPFMQILIEFILEEEVKKRIKAFNKANVFQRF